jgi:DNA processing protein
MRSIVQGEPTYPRRLARVADAPERLFVRGTLADRPLAVAIVGARAASGYGMDVVESLARTLARAGHLVVSGGAVGIDAAAHAGALAGGGVTVAVFACGLDVAYPARHARLFADIVATGGGLATSFRPGVPPRRYHFVRRNRIIAGLVDVVIVAEAAFASGALYTAAAARDYGRVLGALPGTPGCEALIAQGAAVIETAEDVARAVEGRPRRPLVTLPEAGSEEARVLAALPAGAAIAAPELAARTGLALRSVARALTGLELEGLCVLAPGHAYLRSALADELGAS